ncbi:dual adapter for phosphotyrosine and 3-phosphotyrosine and 3-phosphoinositide-like isoform X2 [Halichondria panicea]|uniref:dual adapter for phosphotyrosine and 3-phosphotyrosine and 3-phosphoinositide-like isoform X2 n=1 Tax=Halichondria panicea TaxID=6063 RepID=UPI00312BB802
MSNRISQQHLVVELSQCLSKRKSKSESSLPNATAHFHDEASSYEYEKHKNRTFVEPPVPAIPITQTESILSSKSPLLPNFSRIKENTERHPVAVPTRSVDSVLEQPTERKINTHCSCVSKWTPDVTVKIDILAIVWFHPNLNRHQAEAELRNAEEGVYLLRPRMEGGTCEGYCLGVRSSHVVKHYKITVENGDLVLGQDRFSNLESLEEHFDSHPILGDENDAKVVCRHPYPREIDELHDYQFLSNHFIPTPSRRRMIENATKPRAFSLVSKEGFLVKMGGRVKSWKRRWFVLRDTNLHYYTAVKIDDAHSWLIIIF